MTLPSGERLVYLLADLADQPQHRAGLTALAESYNRNQAMRPLVDWFDEHLASGLQRDRSTGPDGYINAFNRQPAWKGTIRCDESARPIRLD